ncbi:MAG: cupin domain-containing protein [Candidatus Sumerlaeia bacterium]|nr:cupin domain-containing protein [Candidatus Sumerlaeia bacterium]
MKNNPCYLIARFEDIAAVPCPCGATRRAFLDPEISAASIHRLDLSEDAVPHYHKNMTEIYYILEGQGAVELNGEEVSVSPGTAVMIKPGTRHRGKGRMRLLVICIPPFNEADEYFD